MSVPAQNLMPPIDVTQPVEPPDDPSRRVRITVTRKTTDPAAGLVTIAGVLLVIGFASVVALSRNGASPARPNSQPTPPAAAANTSTPARTSLGAWVPTPGMPTRNAQGLGRTFAGPTPTNAQPTQPLPMQQRTLVQPQIELQPLANGPGMQMQGGAIGVGANTNIGSGRIEVRNLTRTRMYVELQGGGSKASVAVEPGSVGTAVLPSGSYAAMVASIDPTVRPYRFQQVIEAGRTHSIPLITQSSQPKQQSGVGSTATPGNSLGDTTTDSAGQSGVIPKTEP